MLKIEEWKTIKSQGQCVCGSDCMCNLQNKALQFFQEKWYKYNGQYYSLLYNQVCCVWIQRKDHKCKYAISHWDIKQQREIIDYFDNLNSLVKHYEYLINCK